MDNFKYGRRHDCGTRDQIPILLAIAGWEIMIYEEPLIQCILQPCWSCHSSGLKPWWGKPFGFSPHKPLISPFPAPSHIHLHLHHCLIWFSVPTLGKSLDGRRPELSDWCQQYPWHAGLVPRQVQSWFWRELVYGHTTCSILYYMWNIFFMTGLPFYGILIGYTCSFLAIYPMINKLSIAAYMKCVEGPL